MQSKYRVAIPNGVCVWGGEGGGGPAQPTVWNIYMPVTEHVVTLLIICYLYHIKPYEILKMHISWKQYSFISPRVSWNLASIYGVWFKPGLNVAFWRLKLKLNISK